MISYNLINKNGTDYIQFRLPENPNVVPFTYLPIISGSLRIRNVSNEIIAESTHRRKIDPVGKKSDWGDIIRLDTGEIIGQVNYSEGIQNRAIVEIKKDFFTENNNKLLFDYSVRQIESRYFPTPHIRMTLEPEEDWNEDILDIKMLNVKNIIDVLRPAHIVIEIALKKKLYDDMSEGVEEELYITAIVEFDDIPFWIYRRRRYLFDRKDWGEDDNTELQYPGTRAGEDSVGVVIDTMIKEGGEYKFPTSDYGNYVRIKALGGLYFDIGGQEGWKVLGIQNGINYTEIIGSTAGDFTFGSNTYFDLYIGMKTFPKLIYTCVIPAGTYTAQQVVEFLRTHLVSATGSKIQGHYFGHTRWGLGGNVSVEALGENIYIQAVQSIFQNGWVVLGIPTGTAPAKLLIGANEENFIITGTHGFFPLRVFWYDENNNNFNLIAYKTFRLNTGTYTSLEIEDAFNKQIPTSLRDKIRFRAGYEDWNKANPPEELSIYAGSPFDEDYTVSLKRDGGLYGSGNVDNKDIDYLYRDMSFPNTREGKFYLRGRLEIIPPP